MSAETDVVARLWGFAHSLRHDGVDYGDYIEQITYLIFIKRLDEMQELEERKATTLGAPLERRIFPEGFDGRGKPVKPGEPPDPGEPYENLRWSRFKHFEPRRMFEVVDEHVFPFIRELNNQGSTYAQHMRDARPANS